MTPGGDIPERNIIQGRKATFGDKMVFVLDRNKRPLMPCTPKRARLLLERKRAAVWRIRPFTIILKDRTLEESTLQPAMLKIAPGAKTTGMALARGDAGKSPDEQFMSPAVLALVELTPPRGPDQEKDGAKAEPSPPPEVRQLPVPQAAVRQPKEGRGLAGPIREASGGFDRECR
jgi:hypothetical protein